MKDQKLHGEERRNEITRILKEASRPITGSELAERASVSRQVIVQDVALLKARDEPILATPQGYIYWRHESNRHVARKVIACRHEFSQTGDELNILVDHGVKVVDVVVEHPLYGEISGSLMLQSREDVKMFIENLEKSGASLLASLTQGVHLHTLEAPSESYLDKACQALAKANILLTDQKP